jgi:hypothetical protein
LATDLSGWTEWCRRTAAGYREGAGSSTGARAAGLRELAAHYEGEASGADRAFSGNKPSRAGRRAEN